MRHETKLRKLEMNNKTITRLDKLSGEVETIPNTGMTNLTQLKNLNPVFDLAQHPKLWSAYLKVSEIEDKAVLKERLHKLAEQKQFAGFARTTADGTKQLKYGLYIYQGIPHSSLSVANCKDGRLHHTGTSLASYSDTSDFITLDKEFYKILVELDADPKLIVKTVSDEVAETLTEEEQIEISDEAEADRQAKRMSKMTDAEILADMTIE